MKYYLFRHGETYFSKHHLPYQDKVESAEILPEGIKQAKTLGQFFKDKSIDVYYSSPFLRCRQTTEAISQITGRSFVFDPRLGEEMITYNKETFEELTARISDFLKELKTKDHKQIAICSHGWPIAAMTALLEKGKVSQSDLANYPEPGGLVEINK